MTTDGVPKKWRRSFAAQRARAYEKYRDDTGSFWEPEHRDLFYAGYAAAWVAQRRIIDAYVEDAVALRRAALSPGATTGERQRD